MARWLRLSAVAALCAAPALAQVVPDGGTATSATTAASGKVTVNIAPVVRDGLSHNTYTRFSVGASGVDLSNVGVGARTIVNQVTGADPSRIQGPLAVVGAPAHVILANPNGVTVDGGSFVNTGRVALSTGVVSFVDRTPTPITTQRNVVLTTTQGEIRIEGAGLAGAFSHLELLAKSIRVAAPITTTSPALVSEVRLTAGASRAEFDSSLFPANTLGQWSAITPEPGSSQGVVLVDITPLANISAGAIRIAVTDAGAGVRHAGRIAAAAGDFTLSADGIVSIEGGTVTAMRDTIVTARRLAAGPGATDAAYAINAGRHVDLSVGSAAMRGGAISAGAATVGGDVSFGIDGFTAVGPFLLAGRETEAGYERLVITARGGGFGIFGADQDVLIAGATIAANQRARLYAHDLTLESPLDAHGVRQSASLVAGRLDGVFTGALRVAGATLQGNLGVSVDADAIDVAATGGGASFVPAAVIADAGDAALFANGAIRVAGSDVIAQRHVTIEGDAVAFGAAGAGAGLHGSRVMAATGALVVGALGGDIVNESGLLQGAVRDATNAGSLGAVTLQAAGSIVNRSLAASPLAIVFAQQDALYASAGGDIANQTGRLIANGDVKLIAGGRFDNVVEQTQVAHAGLRVEYSSRGGWQLFRRKHTNGYYVEYGELVIPGQLAFVVADGSIAIDAASVTNRGGEIDANRGSVVVTTGRLENQAVVTGRAQFERTCAWLCSDDGYSTLTLNGGSFAAAADMLINAAGGVVNAAGRFLALGDLTVNAPAVETTGVTLYRYLERPSGLSALLGTNQGRLRSIDQGGAFIANMGRLTLNTATPVRIDRGALEGGAGVDTPAGRDIVARPAGEPLGDVRHIGLARSLLF
ncbi:MAG: filamentous hemagglutinin N-terminal domain-containing protein [Burkholderiales bacterium]|nr:filamentous hemagglutinin N-terminal domain-containing protein [Burkholderiales bacterium]